MPTPSTARALALAAAALVPLLAAPALAAKAKTIDLATPEGYLQAMRKIQCSTKDDVPSTYWWLGDMYSRVPGERDRLLFRVEGMNVRQCVSITDPTRGPGFRLVSRELLFYRDPATGEVVRKWKNPWTGEELDVMHVQNDPVNNSFFATGRDGRPARWTGTQQGNQWWMTTTVPLFYKDPLGGEYQEYVGGTYHATEMFNFFGDVDDLLDPRKDSAQARVGWVRISDWLPWMKMGGRTGDVYFHTAGRKLASWDDLPSATKALIEAEFPDYRTPPPGDDPRPNETSWTVFKDKKDAARAKQPAAAGTAKGGH
jgi:hypothetical protein